MPKKSKKKQNHWLLIAIAGLFIFAIAWAVASAFVDMIYNFLMANPWVYLLIPAIAIGVLVLRRQDQKEQKAEEAKRLEKEKEMQGQHIQQMLDHKEEERKNQEENRVQGILAHKNEWETLWSGPALGNIGYGEATPALDGDYWFHPGRNRKAARARAGSVSVSQRRARRKSGRLARSIRAARTSRR